MLPWHGLVCLALLPRRGLAQARDVTELFQVDLESDLNGGCAWVGQANLNAMLQDAWKLSVIGVNLMDHYREGVEGIEQGDRALHPEARRLVQRLFALQPIEEGQPDWRADGAAFARYNFDHIRAWLETVGGAYDLSHPEPWFPQPKPHLFCDSDWIETTRVTSKVYWDGYEEFGELIPGVSERDGYVRRADGAYLRVRQFSEIIEARKAHAATELGLFPGDMNLYWSKIHRRYFYSASAAAQPLGHWRRSLVVGECRNNAPWYTGSTQLASLYDGFRGFAAVTICPSGFDGRQRGRDAAVLPDDWKRVWRYEPLRAAGAMDRVRRYEDLGRADMAHAPPNNVGELLSSSAALFHELFHLVLGRAASHPPGAGGGAGPDVNTEAFSFAACCADGSTLGRRQMTPQQRLSNPQSYVWAAYAYLATLRSRPDVEAGAQNPELVEFFSGMATRGVGFAMLPGPNGRVATPRSYGMAWTHQPEGIGDETRRKRETADDDGERGVCAM